MPKANDQSTTSRRAVLFGVTATTVITAGLSAATGSPATAPTRIGAGSIALPAADATLIALAKEFAAVNAEQERIDKQPGLRSRSLEDFKLLNEKSDALVSRLCEITDESLKLRATTAEGLRAKADILRTSLPFLRDGLANPNDWGEIQERVPYEEHALAWSLVRDLLTLPDGGLTVAEVMGAV